jgi:uncharacterized lipoprotein YbaY
MATGGYHPIFTRFSLLAGSLLFCGLFWLGPVGTAERPLTQPAGYVQQSTNSSQSQNPQEPPPQQSARPPVLTHPPFRLALPRRVYQCAEGVQVAALVETNGLRLTLNGNGQIYELKQMGFNGPKAQYGAGPIVWSSDVQTGALQDDSDAAHPKILARDCHLQSAPPLPPPANSITGRLNFAMPKDLPPSAEIRVLLIDLHPPDEAHKYVGYKAFEIANQAPPIPFELKFEPPGIRSKDCCALYAELRVNDKPLYATVKPQPIPDLTHPAPVTLELVPFHRNAAKP